jgi:hypothetical protein
VPAPEKSIHGFFRGLQNRYAILHVAKPPALKKSLLGFFQGLQNRCAILHAAKPPSVAQYSLARKNYVS